MLKSLVSLPQGNVQKSIKLLKIVDIEEENLHIFWTSCRFNEIFKEDMTYNNIKTSQKKRASPFLPKSNFWKNQRTGGGVQLRYIAKTNQTTVKIAFWKKKPYFRYLDCIRLCLWRMLIGGVISGDWYCLQSMLNLSTA